MTNFYYGFSVGQRVSSNGTLGTVVDPGYEPSDNDNALAERRCVPILFDKDAGTKSISWIESAGLIKAR